MARTDTDLSNALYQDYFSRPRNWTLTGTDRTALFTVLACLLLVRLVLMIWLPMTDTTEARYAEIARKMLETGNWITPQYDYGVPFWGKPPLHTWASGLGMKLFGVGHFGARFPILLFAIGVLSVVYVFVRRFLGGDLGLICVAVLASSVLFFGASAFVMTDMVLVFGTTLSMCGFFVAVTGQPRGRAWENAFFVGLAIGLLAKGPVALVLTGLPIFLWLLVGGRWHKLRRIRWGRGSLLLALLSLPWYAAAEFNTPGFLQYFIIGEHFDRFVVPGWKGDLYGSGHAQPTGIIWLYACVAFVPWIVYAGALFWKMTDIGEQILDDTQGWHSYLLFWAISPMLLFTPAANLLPSYVLPALPASSILLCSLWVGFHDKPKQRAKLLFLGAVCGTGALYLCLSLALIFVPQSLNLRTENALTARVLDLDPNLRLTYWGERTYSAEFYSAARVTFTQDLSDVTALRINTQRDAFVVPTHLLPQVSHIIADDFENVGVFRNKHLLVEKVHEEMPL